MTQHTPGPWTIDRLHGEAGKPYVVMGVNDDGDKVVSVLTGQRDGDTWDAETVANADLIAAAPELLEALKAVVLAVANNPTPGPWEQVAAAIAAAEGDAAKHVHSFSTWHDRQDRPARGYSRCACGVEPGDDWAEAGGERS